jgi:tyrosyl-tRNA synthetase
MFLEELRWRGMLNDCTPDLEASIAKGETHTAYVGFDPTAASLTIGNLVSLMLLVRWQKAGGKAIVLLGGATGRIGDPSFKAEERQLLDYDVIERNLQHQAMQFRKFLDFEGENAAIVVNNYDFYKDMSALDFLRDIGKRITISYMLAKDSVKTRISTGLSFTEFSYQLIQGYDFQHLLQHHNCTLQMGGSDQWGNIMTGVEIVRRNVGKGVHALTTPLLTKSDGTKYGKSESGNIWLDADLTSPYQFYQFCLNSTDADMPKLLRIFSMKNQAEIEAIEAAHAEAPHLRLAQRAFSEEFTTYVHSAQALAGAIKVSDLLFSKDASTMESLSANDWAMVAKEIPSHILDKKILENGLNVTDLLSVKTTVLDSNSSVRRAVKESSLSINRKKVATHELLIAPSDLLFGKYLLVENGKKAKFVLVFEG